KPGSVGLPALLALDLIGIQVTQAPDADADAVFHVGQGARVTAAGHPDMTPVMTLGSIDAAGIWLRDPAFPAVPSAIELTAHQTPSRLSAALRATSAATLLDAAVVLPSLSPANRVALWRRACADAWATADLVHEAAALGIRPAAPPATVSLMGAVAADVPTLLALRTWLESRWAWRAG
ncbi:MAG: hypothetical protein H7Z10_09370, partial [Gemmatimonadaceae bacterium]|nr:hypothetical protein [Acetobacteraceae bacterium]